MGVKITWSERIAIGALRRVGGERLARQALRHAHRIYPGNLSSAQSQRWRFMLRTAWYIETSAAWFSFLEASAWRRRQVKSRPKLAELLHRPYRRCDLTGSERLTAATTHWRCVEHSGWTPAAMNFRQSPRTLAEISCKDGSVRQVVLCALEQFSKEGDACLQLRNGSQVIFTAAFSFGLGDEAAEGIVMDIGCLQGPSAADGRSLIRDTTKLLHGLRPRDLLLDALRAVGASVGARAVVGVSSGRHIYRHWRKRRHFAFDYDAYWLERSAVQRLDGDFDLDIDHAPHDVSTIPSKKRAEAKRRFHLQSLLRESVLANLKSAGLDWEQRSMTSPALWAPPSSKLVLLPYAVSAVDLHCLPQGPGGRWLLKKQRDVGTKKASEEAFLV